MNFVVPGMAKRKAPTRSWTVSRGKSDAKFALALALALDLALDEDENEDACVHVCQLA